MYGALDETHPNFEPFKKTPIFFKKNKKNPHHSLKHGSAPSKNLP